MAISRPLWSRKKLMFLFLSKSINTSTLQSKATVQEKQLHGTGNTSSHGIYEELRLMCKEGRLKEALGALYVIDQQGVWVDLYTYASLLQGCVHMKALPEGKLVHAHIIQSGFHGEILVGTKLVNMYTKCGSLVDGRRVLDEMPERNVVTWTSMIAAYAKNGCGEEALELFNHMQRTGAQPNEFTFASILRACANLVALEHGKKIHEGVIRSGFQSDVFVGNALVHMYVKCRSIEKAHHVFEKMPERNVVSWTTMIAGYAQSGHFEEALKLFHKMPERNVFSWNAMITGHAQSGHVDEALKLFQIMPERNVVSWNAMIAGYSQNGYIDEALKFFQEMPERNVVSWTGMIAGYAQNGQFDNAMQLYRQMQLAGEKPDSDTFTSVLPACANLAALHEGKEVHENIIKSGLQSDICVGNALVDMYSKCGSIEDACKVFNKMPRLDVFSWTAMIVGYAMHGYGMEALQLFEQMQHTDTQPDHVTFVGVLSACCHAGLVDDGWKYFESMSQYYHITPGVEHYCCMVDLLGRAGHLGEAQDLISKMPVRPNAAVWLSLLGACRIHTNVELGERVAECLFELDPTNAAHYVLLSNIYAKAGRWDGVEKVRKMMKDGRVKKMPGCSWIEVNNKVYTFIGGHRSHPQKHEIYAELEKLSGQMKEAGYMPDTHFVLHDVEEEQKEHILCYHSEKLAIAFGLINTSPPSPIRIIKNLRVCGDCHSTTKFISKIVAREIVMRDSNRFHHFKDGQCSCADYW
eukprot:Gb_38483 [translate_table: standard]